MNFEMLANFKFAVQIDPYDRTTNPQDHIEIFQQTMVFQEAKRTRDMSGLLADIEGCLPQMVLVFASWIHRGIESTER
jgi:hypothetical protein